MEQYGKWPEEYENYPIQNIMISEMPNQKQLKFKRIVYTNNSQQEPQMYPFQHRNIQERNQYIKYNINNSNQNKNNYNNYSQFTTPNQYYARNNQINSNYIQREYFKSPNGEKNKNTNSKYDKFTKYESPDGVLRGYTNNFSFYESGTSKIKPKTTNYNNNSNNIYTNRNIQFNNVQRTNISQGTTRRYQNNITTNINSNRQIINSNQNDNSSYIIRVIEDEDPVGYNSPKQQQYINNYTDMNYNNNNENVYYNENRYIPQNYRPPTIQRRMVKRVVHKQPNSSRGDYYNEMPRDNLRNYNSNQNLYRNDMQQVSPNIGYRKIISSNINQRNDINSYLPIRRNNTPNAPYSNYSRPFQQRRIIEPNYSENNITSVSYNAKYPYKAYTELNNNYIIARTENNSPRNRSPFIGHSPNIKTNRYNKLMFQNQFNPKQREYGSRTEQYQRGYEYEYEKGDDDDVYEVPEQFNNNNNIINNNYNNREREYIDSRRPNIVIERPFTRINNYSQTERNGRKYGVYTQTLAMNRNYYSNNDGEEYEYEVPNNFKNNRIRENYSQPKIMRPINDVQRLLKNKREYSAFERSLRNIRDNEEEIELENERRNNRVRIKTSGENNTRYISNNNGRPSREYKTFTQQQDYRAQGQGYILQDIDDSNFEDYDMYQNQSNKNIVVSPNEINQGNRLQKQYIQGKKFYEEEQMGNVQNINNVRNIQNYNEQEVDEDDDNDEEEQMYDSSQLITAKEDNFGIVQNIKEKENINNHEIDEEEVEHAQIQMNEGEMEEQRSTENNEMYRREEVPEDRDENILQNGKNLKNIETEINEKYYDNQGNYLGEKKIITTEQVPREEYLQQDDEYYEEQEEIEENENEYIPYQSSHKKFKKRGENMVRRNGPKVDGGDMSQNQNLKTNMNGNNYKEQEPKSKYQSYFGDSNNNVYYEIKGVSGEVKEESKSEEDIGNKSSKGPSTLVKNVTFGIESENLCVPADENENETDNVRESEKKRITNTNTNTINDEKEADEQQVDENAEIEEEEQNQVTLHQKDGNNELPIEQSVNENTNDNDDNGEISENINENINESKKIEYQNTNQNYSNKEENALNNKDEQSYNNHDENNENTNNYEEDNNHDDENNNRYNENDNNYEDNNNLYEESNNNYEEDHNHYDENNNNDKENENENNNIYEEDNNHYSEHNENNNNYEENINNNDENINMNQNIEHNMNMMNENNDEYNNMEYENENQEEQFYEENEGEEIENQNVQKDENYEEEDIGERMENSEQNNNYNYQQEQEQENYYEENDNFDEGREEYNVIEEGKLNKEETIDREE